MADLLFDEDPSRPCEPASAVYRSSPFEHETAPPLPGYVVLLPDVATDPEFVAGTLRRLVGELQALRDRNDFTAAARTHADNAIRELWSWHDDVERGGSER